MVEISEDFTFITTITSSSSLLVIDLAGHRPAIFLSDQNAAGLNCCQVTRQGIRAEFS